jgi:hypothetical protein
MIHSGPHLPHVLSLNSLQIASLFLSCELANLFCWNELKFVNRWTSIPFTSHGADRTRGRGRG